MIKLLEVQKQKKYLAITIAGFLVMFFVYPLVQTFLNPANLDVWWATIPPINLALYIIFSALFGLVLSLQIYQLRQPKVCKPGTVSGTVGTVLSFFIAQCPACAGLASLLLPVGAVL